MRSKVDKDGSTALHLAAFNGHINVVAYLIEKKKVDVNKVDNIGQTALHYAASEGHKDMVAYLIEKAGVDVNKVDNNGSTALHYAAAKDHKEVVQYLVQNKNLVLNKNVMIEGVPHSPIELAVRRGKHEIADFLRRVVVERYDDVCGFCREAQFIQDNPDKKPYFFDCCLKVMHAECALGLKQHGYGNCLNCRKPHQWRI